MLSGLACALLFVSPLRSAAPAQVGSVAPLPGTTGAGNSFGASASSDGGFVAFVSQANNLVTNDDQGPHLDVFLRSLGTSNTVLVSVDRSGFGGGNGNSVSPAVQRNGQRVVFESMASNLVENDTNGVSDVFVRDLVTRTTRLVSVDVTGTNGGNGPSTSPLIGEYAIWVVFASQANNLVPNDTNGVSDVFARDLVAGTNACVSSGATAAGPGVGPAESPALAREDGSVVAFVKRATNTTAAGPLSFGEIYVYDLQDGSTTLASSHVASEFSGAASYRCFNPALLAGGRLVAFKATGPGSPILLFVHDLRSNTTVRISNNLTNAASWPATSPFLPWVAYDEPSGVYVWEESSGVRFRFEPSPPGILTCGPPFMSFNGSVAFVVSSNYAEPYPYGTRTTSTLWVHEPGSGQRIVSVSTNGAPASVVPWAEIAFAGENVVFESLDEHLVPGDFNQASDVFVRDLSRDTTRLVSQRHADRPPATGAGWCLLSPRSVSAEGRRLVFASFDSDLAERDTNGWPDLFVHDRGTGTNLPVSVDPLIVTNPPGGSPGLIVTNPPFRTNSTGRDPAISADGRFVAFVWRSGFHPQLHGVRDNVYLRDLEGGRNEVVNLGYASIGNASASAPSIGAEGRYVAFHSAATDLVQDPPVSGTFTNVYLFDRLGTNPPFFGPPRVQLLSVNRANSGGGSGHSTEPLISPDSRWVLFASTAQDLVTDATGGRRSLFARDVTRRVTKLVSVSPDGSGQWGYTNGAVFSADSRFVAFVSADSNLVVHDLLAGISRLVSSNAWNPSLSADGRLVAYEWSPIPGPKDTFLKDLQSGALTVISVNRAGTRGGNGDSVSPQISYDGQFVAFASKASDLVENDTNGRMDIFVRDRLRQTTLLVSLNRQGTASGNGASTRPVLAPDGHTVVFQSLASDLVDGDYNTRRDVFALSLGAGDADADGLDDDWEVTYFGDLSHDGAADTDADGYTDLQEYQAGTDPTNAGSVLRVLSLHLAGGPYSYQPWYYHETTVLWSAAPARTYRVQVKTNVTDRAWTDRATVTASGTTASWKDVYPPPVMPRPTRFYRVVLEP